MKNVRLLLIVCLLIISYLFIYASCNKNNNCAEMICTANFASVGVQLRDGADKPISAEEVFTIRVKTGDTLRFQQDVAITGYYSILDDSFQNTIVNIAEQFKFIAMKNNVKIAEELYEISADCCHIKKISGKEKIIL